MSIHTILFYLTIVNTVGFLAGSIFSFKMASRLKSTPYLSASFKNLGFVALIYFTFHVIFISGVLDRSTFSEFLTSFEIFTIVSVWFIPGIALVNTLKSK